MSPASTPWDSWRYFNNWGGLTNFVANLQLTDNPSSTDYPSIGTVCTVLQGGYWIYQGQTFGFWLPQRMPFQDTDGKYGVQNLALQNIIAERPAAAGGSARIDADQCQLLPLQPPSSTRWMI